MKKTLVSAALAAFLLPLGAQADNGPGCGVGQMIFKGQSGLLPHTLAATTNGSTYNQWFGLTSGTLECNPEAVVSNEFQREVFVAANMDSITQEMARGNGDHLTSLADLMGISASDRDGFFALTKAQFSALMDASDDGAKGMLVAIDSAMMTDAALAKYVR